MGARIAHGNQKIKGIVRVAHNEEQGRFFIAQSVQLQLVIGRDLAQLRDVKGRKPSAAAHQNRLRGFACCLLSRTS